MDYSNKTMSYVPASKIRRFICGCIDLGTQMLLLFIFALIFEMIYFWLVGVGKEFMEVGKEEEIQFIKTNFLSLLLLSIIFLTYSIYFHAKYGKTVGKMIGGCKVKLLDGSSITLRVSIIRALFHDGGPLLIISSTYFPFMSMADNFDIIKLLYQTYTIINLSFIIIHRRNRALHDLVAGTIVVNDG